MTAVTTQHGDALAGRHVVAADVEVLEERGDDSAGVVVEKLDVLDRHQAAQRGVEPHVQVGRLGGAPGAPPRRQALDIQAAHDEIGRAHV